MKKSSRTDKTRKKHFGIFYKYTLVIIGSGLLPILLITSVLMQTMIQNYQDSILKNYQEALYSVQNRIDTAFSNFNTVTKMPSNYNLTDAEHYMSFNHFRNLFYGNDFTAGEKEEKRRIGMQNFLQNLLYANEHITAAHFIGVDQDGSVLSWHTSRNRGLFINEKRFREYIKWEETDRTSRQLAIYPMHASDYFAQGRSGEVLTVARNFYDLSGSIQNMNYIGSLYLDIDADYFRSLISQKDLMKSWRLYIVNNAGLCYYSTNKEAIGSVLPKAQTDRDNKLVRFTADDPAFDLFVVADIDLSGAFASVTRIYQLAWLVICLSVFVLIVASVLLSRRLTKPINEMIRQMERIETGDFDIVLDIDSRDEIAVLSERFNQMSRALKLYIDKAYVMQLRQKEAELTALKSQIYPHFLYNTLEVIRMTALDTDDRRVAEMIEALSEQIHYLIGPVEDMVPLEKEIEIVRKYVFLLNCRIDGGIKLEVNSNCAGILIPKLILQPIVENAYIHGIKPNGGKGKIFISTELKEEMLEICVMDNGVGMQEQQLQQMLMHLESDELGVKDEYNWKSIGMKNVNDRIRYLYGQAYGLHVTSKNGFGTIVRIVLPGSQKHLGEQHDLQRSGGERLL